MDRIVKIGSNEIGKNKPVYIIAEIGINHNGDIDIAKKLIDAAVVAECNAVKFQKRTPELCVPDKQKDILRETPWGIMKYLDYKKRIEFNEDEYSEIFRYCREKNIDCFVSCWDLQSLAFIEKYNPVCYKIASASLTDDELLIKTKKTGRPVILSTGMSSIEEIDHAVSLLDIDNLIITHSTSSYPCKPEELNLRMINTLEKRYNCPIGYSGHEVGLQTTYATVSLGACLIERHITLDRAMWGTDQAASIEPWGFMRLVRDIRNIEKALGDGVKKVYNSEIEIRNKLRNK